MTAIAFVDTETLGLDPDRHAVWEVGLVLYDPEVPSLSSGRGVRWQIRLTEDQINDGDPIGMDIGGFHDRYDRDFACDVRQFLTGFVGITKGLHLAGAVVSFDEERLRRLAQYHAFTPKWHYHLIDVEAVAIGALAARGVNPPLPWKSDDLSAALGVSVSDEDRHTALGDARWAMRLYEAATAPLTQGDT